MGEAKEQLVCCPLRRRLVEVAVLFLRLGTTAFGGPAAHIAMMHDEVVKRRKWLSDQEFLDLLGATNLIPGPNSTEMAIHLGLLRAGWLGLIVAGACFILPAMCIVTALAWAYVEYGTTPAAGGLLGGVKPVMIAIIAKALWDLGKKAVKSRLTAAVGAGVLALTALAVNEVALLVLGGAAVMLVENVRRLRKARLRCLALPLAALGLPVAGASAAAFSLSGLFFTFLKIGSVLYGSGYVLLAFMRADFVGRLGWLTDQQLIDAIAVGQVTPGPVFTTATFVGYVLGGWPGGLAATLGIFLPSFVFVALTHRLISRLRESVWLCSLLDGVNVASLALMAAVTLQLGRASLVDPLSVSLALGAGALVVWTRVNTTWLVLGGALVGLARASVA
jgi:chromate transporter